MNNLPTTSFKYRYIQNNSPMLLIYFNNMTQCGHDDVFSLYKKLPIIFHGYDILYVKDTHLCNWYLPIMNELTQFITQLSIPYTSIFGLSDSSGTMPMLNILPGLRNFRKAVSVNGQCSLEDDVISKWRHVQDCYHYSELPNIVQRHKSPLRHLPSFTKYEITMYYNYNGSDAVYHDYVKEINNPNIIVKREDLQLCHVDYIVHVLSSRDKVEEIRKYLETNY